MSNPKQLLLGNYGSPYTRKMIATLRYRQIPYELIWGDASNPPQYKGTQLPKAKPPLLPTFYFEDEQGVYQAKTDSTPLIRQFETQYPERSVIPESPSVAFLNSLLEDFADEWGTKYMFHYRWNYDADIDRAGTLIPLWIDSTMSPPVHQKVKAAFAERQISRLHYVGSTAETGTAIEASYQRLLMALEAHFTAHRFLFGKRPASADFALYGQLSQLLAVDPTPMQIAHRIAPRTVAWMQLCDDLSGLEPSNSDWFEAAKLPASLTAILAEVGKTYVPAMIANAQAAINGDASWQTEVDGALWQQNTFPYQAKCVKALREEYAPLTGEDKQTLSSILSDTGCSRLLD